jgi:hypothetical protein
MKKLYCLIAIIGLSMIFTAPLALAQNLGGKWFQVTFSVKGYEGGSDYYSVSDQVSAKTVNYFQFVYNDLWSTACPAGYTPQFYPFYEIHVWYPEGAGWNSYVSDYVGPNAGDHCYGILCPRKEAWAVPEKTFLDRQFVTIGHGDWLAFGGGSILEGWANAWTILDIKRDGVGAIKSATLKSFGCASEFAGGGGSCTIKGKLIKPEKLPSGIPAAGLGGPVFTTVDACLGP